MSVSQTDTSGKKLFRLDKSGNHEAMFDPYYITRKNEESAQQTAYEQFYRKNPNCNNYVGDYKQNYKYQTSINRECWQAFAQSELMIQLVAKTLKQCITANQDQNYQFTEENKDAQTFKKELFPVQTMYMCMKLMIIICQNNESQTTFETIRQDLQADLLSQAFSKESCQDAKLSEIGLYLRSLLYKEDFQEERKDE